MTKRKKIILLIIALAVLAISYGAVSSLRSNYMLGQELYRSSNDLLHQVSNLIESIDYLDQQFKDPNQSADDVDRYYFDESIRTIRWNFGYENMPLLDEVRLEWIHRFEEIYEQARSDEDLQAMSERGEQKLLLVQLTQLANVLSDITDGYWDLPSWKHYLTSWDDMRDSMSTQARIALTDSVSHP